MFDRRYTEHEQYEMLVKFLKDIVFRLEIFLMRLYQIYSLKLLIFYHNFQFRYFIVEIFQFFILRKLVTSICSRRIVLVESLLTPSWKRQALVTISNNNFNNRK